MAAFEDFLSGDGDIAAEAPDKIFCTECGTQLESTAKFCHNCGAKIAPPVQFDGAGEDDGNDDEQSDGEAERSDEYDPFGGRVDDKDNDDAGGDGDDFDPFAGVDGDHGGEAYVVVFSSGPTGLTVKDDWSGNSAVVDELPYTQYMKETGNKVKEGHVLVEINGESCAGLSAEAVSERLAEVENVSHKLKLRPPRDMSGAFGGADSGTVGARSEIHRRKGELYAPPDHMDMVYGYCERFRGDRMITFHFLRESDGKFMCAASVDKGGKGTIVFHMMQDIKYQGTASGAACVVRATRAFR